MVAKLRTVAPKGRLVEFRDYPIGNHVCNLRPIVEVHNVGTWGFQYFIYLSRKEGNERIETSLCVLGHVLRCHIFWDMS
jgi:hypothetical protein